MTNEQEDLLRILDVDIDSTEDDEDLLQDFLQEQIEEDGWQELSESVLHQDEWDRKQGEVLNEKHKLESDSVSIADFHSLAYHLFPEVVGQCTNKRRQEFIETMMDSPEYRQLHQSTQHNLLTSEMATIRFAQQFADLKRRDAKYKQQNPKAGPMAQPDGNCLTAVSRALSEAQKEVEEIEEMQRALGDSNGLGQGLSAEPTGLDSIKATYQRLRSSNRLREIFERAGAYRRAGQASQKQKTKHGYDDMIGVEMAGDPGRLLSNELVLLDDEDLELDLLRRIVENQAMCRLYQAVEEKNKGPVVVVVDESGSMNGPKIVNAKALALAMAWIAKHQNRWCALVGFSGGKEGVRCVLKPGRWDQAELVNWLDHFYGGGTTLDVPLQELPGTYWEEMKAPKGKTDVIMITDAIVHAPHDMIASFNQWKTREQVRCISIVLNYQAGDMEKVSDEVHVIPNLTVDCEATSRCLTI